MDKAFIEEYMRKLNFPTDENGIFHLVFWSDKTLGVIHEDDIVSLTKADDTATGRARFDNQTYDVVFIVKGTNEDDLFKLAQKITNDFGVLQNKTPQENKRKPKRRKMDDFVEADEQVSNSNTIKTGKSISKGKKDAGPGRVVEKKRNKNQSSDKETKKSRVTEKKKTDKEEAVKERKEKETSRVATMTNCASFIINTLSCSQSQSLDEVSTNCETENNINKHDEISTMQQHVDRNPSYSESTGNTHLHVDRNLLHGQDNHPNSPFTASPISVPSQQKDYLNSIHSPQPVYAPGPLPGFMSSPHAFSPRQHCFLPPDNSYQEPYPFFNNSGSFISALPPYPTNPIASPNQKPTPYSSYLTTNPGSLIKDSLSVAEDELCHTCQECVLKDTQILSLTEANEKAQTDLQALHQRIRELEGEVADIRQSHQAEGSSQRHEDPVTKHYCPARGPQVELCRFEDIPLTESPPADMLRLAEGELLCVPNTWMTRVLAVSKGKGPAFLLKKMVDGFFEPEELQGRKAKELGNNNTIMRAIKMYAINELKMKETTFIHELNSKLNSFRRVMKEKRNEKRN